MPRFSEFFTLGLSQHQLDFVDVSNEFDTPVYVDPYAIEVQDDLWAAEASNGIRVFFTEILQSLRDNNTARAVELMSHLTEPKETFLGVSRDDPKGRGVGRGQAAQLINSIRHSKAYTSGILSDLSEVALYVDGINRDKISDLTTNIIRGLLVTYTQQQCELLSVPVRNYNGPPLWNAAKANWIAQYVKLPYIDQDPVLLVPKYIVRRQLSLDSQEFYNKQITDFLIAENIKANSSLVQLIKGSPVVRKGAVREANPKSKPMIADFVIAHPELLDLYKEIAKKHSSLVIFDDKTPSIHAICGELAKVFSGIKTGTKSASAYHTLVMGSLTALFYPDLIQPHKEWEIDDGRKRIDIVFTNSADEGFFAQRRSDHRVNANTVIVECKNYSDDIANQEFDQLIGRFDEDKGKFGVITCRTIENEKAALARCKDAAKKGRGYIIVLTDDDIIAMLKNKSELHEDDNQSILYKKYRDIIS